MKNKQKNFDSKVSKKVIYASSALLAATAFATVISSDMRQSIQGVNPVVQAATDLQVARLDGLYTNTNSITFYVPGAQSHNISAIGVQRPGQKDQLWWSSSIVVSEDKQHFTVSFTNPDNLAFINNEANIGKSMSFELQFDNKKLKLTNYQKQLDSSELMNAKKQGKSSIDALVNLTAQQSEDYKTQIENSQNPTQVNTFVNQAKATNDLATLNQYKNQAKNNIQDSADKVIAWIKSLFRFDRTGMMAKPFINKIDTVSKSAQSNIDKATSKDAIDTIVSDANSSINQVKSSSDSKLSSAQNQAKKELQTKYNSLNNQLNAMSDLPGKSDLQAELTNTFNSENAAIEGASSADDANSKKSTAITKLEAVLEKAEINQKSNQDNRLANNRNQAKADLDNQYQQLQDKLNSLPDISPKKSGLTQRVTEFNSQSNQDSLTQASDEASLAQAKTNLTQTFNTLANDLDTAKLQQEVTDLINTKSTAVKDAIDGMGSITGKSKILNSITNTASDLTKNIPDTLSDLAIYKEKISRAFDQIRADADLLNQSNLEQVKNDAKRAINQKADEVKGVVNELSDPQKTQLQSELNDKSKAGRDNVDGASKSADALLAKDSSLIDLEALKQKANQAKAGQQAANNNQRLAQSAQDYIQGLQPLSDDKKLEFNKQVNDLVSSYHTKLAGDNSDVNALSTSFAQDLEKIKSAANLDNQKQILDSQITQKNADAQKVIDNSYNLDSGQRSQLTKDLTQKTKDLRQSVSGAQNTADLETKKSEIGQLDNFAKDTKLADDKAKAAHDLKTKAQEVKNNLDKLPGLEKDKIESAQTSIDDKLNDALKGDFVTNKDNILSGFTDIFNTQKSTSDSSKETIKNNLADKMSTLTTDIGNPFLEQLRNKLNPILEDAKTKIGQVKSYDQMKQIENLALANMEDEYNQLKLADDKAKASATLSENIDSENGRIDNLTGLSPDEQQAAKAELKAIKDQLPTAFDGLDSDNAIAQKQLELQNQINQVYDEYNQKSNKNFADAKTNTKSRLQAQRDDLLKKLGNEADFKALTKDEKQSYADKVNNAFDETAKDNAKIDNSKSTQAIGYLEQATKAKLTDLSNQVKLANLKKQILADLTSNSTIDKLEDFKQQGLNGKELDETPNYKLTPDQQSELNKDIQDIIDKSGISSSSSESEVQEKYNRALADIGKKYDDAVKLRQKNIDNAKASAISELKAPSLDNLNLTETQKQSFISQINQKLSDGEANINNSKESAVDKQIISQYKDSANQGMQAILEQAQLQSYKNTAIYKANQHRDNQKRAINQMLGLSDTDKSTWRKQIDDNDNSVGINASTSKAQIDSLLAQNNATIEDVLKIAQSTNQNNISGIKDTAKNQLDEINNNIIPTLKNTDLNKAYTSEVDKIKSDTKSYIDSNEHNNPSDIAYQLEQAKLKVADVKRRADLDQKRENARQQLVKYAQKLNGQLDKLQPVDQADKDNAKDLINLISDEADFGSANSQAEITQILSQKQKDMADHYQSAEDIKQANLESERTDRFEKLAEQVDNLQNEIINQRSLTPEQQEQYINQLYTALFNANDDLQQAPSFKDMNDIETTMNKVVQDVVKDAKLTNDNQQPTPAPTPVPTDDDNDSPQPTNQKPTASEVSQEVGQAVKQAQDTINQNTTLTPQQKQNYLNALTNLQTESNNQLNQPGFDPSTFNKPNLTQNVQAILTSFNDFVKSQPTNQNNKTPNNQPTNTNTTANTQNAGNNTIANNGNGNPTQNAGTTRTNSGNSYRYYPATTAQTGGSQGQLEPANSGQTQNGNGNRDTGGLIQRSNQGNNRSSVANGGSNGPVNKVANLNKDNDSGQSNNWWNAIPYIGALIVAIGGIFWLIAKRRKDDDEE